MGMSRIKKDAGGTLYAGNHAVEVIRMFSQAQALLLWADCKMKITRGWTMKRGLEYAENLTGKQFKRTPEGCRAASHALRAHATTLRDSILLLNSIVDSTPAELDDE